MTAVATALPATRRKPVPRAARSVTAPVATGPDPTDGTGDAGGIGGTDGTGGVSGGSGASDGSGGWGGAHPHPAASCAKRLVLSLGVATVAQWADPGAGRRRTVTAPGGTALVVAGAEPQLALAAQQAARSSISKPTTPYAAFRGAARDSG